MNPTPVSLLERLRRPDDGAAWDRFVQLYTPLLYRWLLRTGLQEADVADLLQDVLATLLHRLPEFAYDPGRSFHRWLYTVVMNLWRDRQKRRAPVALAALDPPADDDLDSFIEREYRDQLVQRVWAILRTDFSPATAGIFHDVVILGHAPADVAAAHGLAVGAVYAIKHRVLARIRNELVGIL